MPTVRRRRVPRSLLVALAALGTVVAAIGSATGAAAAIHPAQASIHTKELRLEKDEVGIGRVRCPKGKVAISGGTAFHRIDEEPTHALAAKLIASGPLPNGRAWHGAGMSFEDDPIDLRLTVVCRAASAVGAYTVRTKDIPVDETTRLAVGTLGCPAGQRFVTGGAIWNPDPDGPPTTGTDNLHRSTPTQDGKRWKVEGFAFAGPDHILRIVLLCRPSASIGTITVRHRDIVSPVESDRGGSVGCGRGKRAIAGGADWFLDGSPSAIDSGLTSSSVRSNGKGWYAAGDMLHPEIALRVTVLCVAA